MQVPNYETRPSIIIDHHRSSKPNSTPMPNPHSPPRLSRNGSNGSNRSGSGSSQEIKLNPLNICAAGRAPSIIHEPLPPIPGSEPLYEELPQDRGTFDMIYDNSGATPRQLREKCVVAAQV